VNGGARERPAIGCCHAVGEPLELGLFEGVLDELRIENPAAPSAGRRAGGSSRESRDSTEPRHHLSGKGAGFVPVPGGRRSGPVPRESRLRALPSCSLPQACASIAPCV